MPGLNLGSDNASFARGRSGSVTGSQSGHRVETDTIEKESSFGASTSTSFSKGSRGRNIPPPLAESTPKKRQTERRGSISGPGAINGINGVASSSTNTPLNGTNVTGINGAGPTPKKRKVVHLEDDDVETEEDRGIGYTASPSMKINGNVNRTNGFGWQKRKSGMFTPNGKAKLVNGMVNGEANSKSAAKYAQLQEQRRQLPIAKGKDALIREIKENDTVVLLGETGSGKTTQVPQYIVESGLASTCTIAITQPRRIAATSLAARVAQERGSPLGQLVGFSVRFNEATSPATRIKYLTDGMLARERLADPLLKRYGVVIVDEAHERTLNTDLVLAGLRGVQTERRRLWEEASKNTGSVHTKEKNNGKGKGKAEDEVLPLKVVIMSATLDAEKFSRYFDNAKILYIKGRQHPVKIYHTSTSQTDYVDSALRTFFQIHVDQPPGDVLIFLPGQEDIESLDKAISSYAAQLPIDQMRVLTVPFYASLPQNMQNKAFGTVPSGTRKCILATNIAETSITIPGVKYVIDSGKCKEKRFVAGATGGGIDTLLTQDISKSSAMQRTGRAGREGPGFCFRLYTEADFNKLPVSAIPEIQRCSLTSSMLQLKCLGQNMEELEFMDPPDVDAISSALKSLFLLGAIGKDRSLTPIGRLMNTFPLSPPYSRSLLASIEHRCVSPILGIISLLSSGSKLFFDPPDSEQRDAAAEARSKFRHPSGDHMTTLAALRAYEEISKAESRAGRKDWCKRHFLNERALTEAVDIQEQLRGICDREGIEWDLDKGEGGRVDEEPVLRSLLVGMAQHTAILRSEGGYKQVMGLSIIKIHPGSTLSDRKAPAIMYDELVFTGSTYARGVSAIPPTFIHQLPVFSIRKA